MNNQKLHEEVKKLARIYLESERNLIGPLIQVKQLKAYRDFECRGLDEYCEKQLGFSESVARMFQTVINHAIKKPALRKALETDRLSVTYASKIVSQLTDENIEEVLEFTKEHSISETERWLDEKSGGDQFRNLPVRFRTLDLLKKIMDATPGHGKGKSDDIVYDALHAHYEKVHPVEKARRAAEKKAKRCTPEFAEKAALRKAKRDARKKAKADATVPQSDLAPENATAARNQDSEVAERSAELKQQTSSAELKQKTSSAELQQRTSPAKSAEAKRIPLTAEQKNAVHRRDGYRCTQTNHKGARCRETKYLHIHHVQFVSEGGGNEPENLTTLCAEHHDLVHQMSFSFEDAPWVDLKNPVRAAPPDRDLFI